MLASVGNGGFLHAERCKVSKPTTHASHTLHAEPRIAHGANCRGHRDQVQALSQGPTSSSRPSRFVLRGVNYIVGGPSIVPPIVVGVAYCKTGDCPGRSE